MGQKDTGGGWEGAQGACSGWDRGRDFGGKGVEWGGVERGS